MMGFLSIALFVMLMAFGRGYFGWTDPHGMTTMALICAFVFGVIAGLKAKG
jgi:uncharacterized membrane protein (DUF4010 family)